MYLINFDAKEKKQEAHGPWCSAEIVAISWAELLFVVLNPFYLGEIGYQLYTVHRTLHAVFYLCLYLVYFYRHSYNLHTMSR